MSEAIIEVKHLSKSFGTHVVLRDVDFAVNPGDVTCVIGASGSGKSTLLRCINLLETPTNGQVLFHGQDITTKGSDPCAYRAKVGMVPAGRSSAWRLPAPCRCSRRCCCLTSRPPRWIPRWWARC